MDAVRGRPAGARHPQQRRPERQHPQWAETQGLPDDGGVRTFFATFLVQHAAGRTIPGVRIDANFDGSDNTPTVGVTGVTAKTFVASAGGIETSRVTVGIHVGKPGGFGCPFIGGATRSVDAPIRMRVQDSTNEQSATVRDDRALRRGLELRCSRRLPAPALGLAERH